MHLIIKKNNTFGYKRFLFMFKSRKDTVYIVLSGIFITNAIVAELIGGKLIDVGSAVMSIGILPWPIVFVTTDLINEYFGEKGVKKLSLITASLICYCFVLLYFAMKIPTSSISTVSNSQFGAVFGQSMWIIVGSIVAFLVSQFIDVKHLQILVLQKLQVVDCGGKILAMVNASKIILLKKNES